MIEDVEFQSEGAQLRGRLFRPDADGDAPLVIMAHGTSATIHMVADARPPALEPSQAGFDALRSCLLDGDVPGGPHTTVGPLPVVARPARHALAAGARPGVPLVHRPRRSPRHRVDQQVTRAVPDTVVPYSPVPCAPFVTAPTLMMVAPDDEMRHADYDVARLVYELLPAPKQWHDIAGGHFGLLYHPSRLFDEAASIQVAFLEPWLLPTGRG